MFAIHTGRAFAAALVLTVVPAAGFAATFDVLQQRANISNDGTGVKSVSGQISTANPTLQDVVSTTAGSFHLSRRETGSGDPYEDFIAFCIEVTQSITTNTSTPVSYTEDNSLFGGDRRELMATLLGTAFDPSQGAQHHAATQLALWKIGYGDISSPSGDAFDVTARSFENLPGGTFLSFNDGDVSTTFDDNSAGVFALAQGWLDQLDGDAGNGEWTRLAGNRVSFLTAGGSQNLVTYTAPVPVPAAGGLLVGAIAGLAALRRRRTTA